MIPHPLTLAHIERLNPCESGKFNVWTCGCQCRWEPDRWFLCAYHSGFNDAVLKSFGRGVIDRLTDRWPFHTFQYRCAAGHYVTSDNPDLDGDDEMGECPVPGCTALIGDAFVAVWMLRVLDGEA